MLYPIMKKTICAISIAFMANLLLSGCQSITYYDDFGVNLDDQVIYGKSAFLSDIPPEQPLQSDLDLEQDIAISPQDLQTPQDASQIIAQYLADQLATESD